MYAALQVRIAISDFYHKYGDAVLRPELKQKLVQDINRALLTAKDFENMAAKLIVLKGLDNQIEYVRRLARAAQRAESGDVYAAVLILCTVSQSFIVENVIERITSLSPVMPGDDLTLYMYATVKKAMSDQANKPRVDAKNVKSASILALAKEIGWGSTSRQKMAYEVIARWSVGKPPSFYVVDQVLKGENYPRTRSGIKKS